MTRTPSPLRAKDVRGELDTLLKCEERLWKMRNQADAVVLREFAAKLKLACALMSRAEEALVHAALLLEEVEKPLAQAVEESHYARQWWTPDDIKEGEIDL